MKHSESKIVRLVEPKGQAVLSKAQQLFNKLIKKIDRERKQLAAWQETIPLCQEKYTSEFVPLIRTFNTLKGDLIPFSININARQLMKETRC